MMADRPPIIICCNGAAVATAAADGQVLHLDYQRREEGQPNVRLRLPDFVRDVYHLPDRCLDLLEMAAYVFAADRLVQRGRRDDVEYHGWSRSVEFHIRVRDFPFWSNELVGNVISRALEFMTGDKSYAFVFYPGHSTPPTSLFDRSDFKLESLKNVGIVLFSGGLDSLAGAFERLSDTNEHICLVSHQSQPDTTRTQEGLAKALSEKFPNRISHYRFRTNLSGTRAREETQRSRAFLYASIAFALSQAFSVDRFFIYENGITSMNFPRREDLSNGRASRTTHPTTMRQLQDLFSSLAERPFKIEAPFVWKTKTDVIEGLVQKGYGSLIASSVSCSQTFRNLEQSTHCGECFQCVDRRVALYAAKADDHDHSGLYGNDVIISGIRSREGKTTAMDYLRQARNFATWSEDRFYNEMLDELHLLLDCFADVPDEISLVNKVHALCSRHGLQVYRSLERMRELHENLYQPLAQNSLLRLISEREFLKEPIDRLVSSIEAKLRLALPKMFHSRQPEDERDLNDKVRGLLQTWHDELRSEHPAATFACAGVVPDHTIGTANLLIEAKYIRSGTPPSKATDGIAADLVKYPQEAHILFVVYDPSRAIPDRDTFKKDLQSQGRCTVCLLP